MPFFKVVGTVICPFLTRLLIAVCQAKGEENSTGRHGFDVMQDMGEELSSTRCLITLHVQSDILSVHPADFAISTN